MRRPIAFTRVALVLLLASIESVAPRCLHQHSQEQHAGIQFSFSKKGGAAAVLQKLQHDKPQMFQQILQRAVGVLPDEAIGQKQTISASSATAQDEGQAVVHVLAKHLDQDPGLGVDLDGGALVYECPGVKLDPMDIQLGGQDSTGSEPDPLASQAFQLSSRSSASRKVFLDFGGGTVTNTAWNVAYSNINVPPFDMDRKPGEFSVAERNAIVAVWRAVSEDYSIFDVDVTTIRPGASANAVRVCIGGSGAWYGGGAGGVAFLGTFGDARYSTAFVFPQNLGPDYPKFMAEAVSHEVGHTLGLMHDGDATSPYFTGQGDFASIMGVGYYKQLTTWDNGAYLNSNNPQDDVQVMARFLPLIKQQAGSSIATATPLTPTVNGTISTTGVIVQPSVANMWSFQAAAGTATFSVQVQPAWEGWAVSNLDAQLTIADAAGNVLGSQINPAGVNTDNGLGIAAASVVLPAAGTYYVAVTGAGSGNPKDGSSYSSYGSRGRFGLRASFTAAGSRQDHPSPSPSPEAAPSPSPAPDSSNSKDPQDQQQHIAESISPNPDLNQQPAGDDVPVQLALLSQFPTGVQPLLLPTLRAVGARGDCTREPSAQVGVDGVAAATPGDAGKCSSTVPPGAYTLASSNAPEGFQLVHWQCYSTSDGFSNGLVTSADVLLGPASVISCVAVFAEEPAASPSPSPAMPSPSPEAPITITPDEQSPSPSPEPSPSPSPDTKGLTTSNQPKLSMHVAQITLDKRCAKLSSACSCTAKVLVVASDTRRPVRDAHVTGTWRSHPEAWAPDTHTQPAAGRGQVNFTAQRQQSGSCLFAVTDVRSETFTLDRSASVRSSYLQLQASRYRSGSTAAPPAIAWLGQKP